MTFFFILTAYQIQITAFEWRKNWEDVVASLEVFIYNVQSIDAFCWLFHGKLPYKDLSYLNLSHLIEKQYRAEIFFSITLLTSSRNRLKIYRLAFKNHYNLYILRFPLVINGSTAVHLMNQSKNKMHPIENQLHW